MSLFSGTIISLLFLMLQPSFHMFDQIQCTALLYEDSYTVCGMKEVGSLGYFIMKNSVICTGCMLQLLY